MSDEVPVEPVKEKEAPPKEIIESEKSEDKKDIEDEEKEKMLNEENKKEIGEVEKKKKALEEAAEREGGRKRIPTGGIKIPGFLRSRSRDKNKDGEEKDEEADLLEPPCTATTIGSEDEKTDSNKKSTFTFMNPFAKKKKTEESAASSDPEAGQVPLEKRPGFLHAIKLPLVNVIPKKLRSTREPDVEEGGGSAPSKPAGLASMETLDDSNGSTKHSDEKGEEGLETVKLDSSEEKAPLESEKTAQEKKPWDREAIIARLAPLKEFKYIIGGVCLFLLLLIIIIVIAVSGPRPLTSSPIIDGRYVRAVTSCGLVEGMLEDGAVVFRGIPYARPPVGELRWRKPEPLTALETCWNGTLKTHNATDACWQVYKNGTINGQEDCLTLDIVTPQVRYINPLPVVVLFGAESLAGGSPGHLDLPPPRLSRIRDVIFVRPNFRMNVLGYLAAKALTNSTYPLTSGNYGLQDAVEALRWIKTNIVHFAGDPNSITVLGHRAGATMLTAIAASHKVDRLFNRAWLASGSAVFPGVPLAESEEEALPYIRKLNCNERDHQCLRQKDVEELIDNIPDNWVKVDHDLPSLVENRTMKHQWLVVDGVVIKEHPLEVWKQGNLSVQIVMGTTAHADAMSAMWLEKAEWTDEEVKAKVANSILGYNKTMTDEVLKHYNTTWAGLAAAVSDIRTVCPLLNLASQIPATPFYVVTQPRGEPRVADVNADVDAILERYNPRTPEERRYVSAIQQIFYRFVSLGKFDHHPSDASNNKILLIGQDALPSIGYPNCDFWFSNDIVPRFARID